MFSRAGKSTTSQYLQFQSKDKSDSSPTSGNQAALLTKLTATA